MVKRDRPASVSRMKPEEVAAALANLPDDALITVSVRAGDWFRARQAREEGEGPEFVSSRDAARIVGRSSSYWQKLAKSGKLAGATQSEGGHWMLPLAACRVHIRGATGKGTEAIPGSTQVPFPILTRGRPRPPRRPSDR